LLGLHLRLRIAVAVRARQRFALVGAVMMARRIDAEAADVDESRQRLSLARIEQHAKVFDVRLPIFRNWPPVADLCCTVNDNVGFSDGRADKSSIAQFSAV